jgi:uncharacterized protein YbgA (DUF1722 family)
MRIWDVPAGYLSRQSLLGEHRELHGLESVLVHGKRGYSRHPETLRWVGCREALCRRHEWLVAEMTVRGYVDRTPLARGPSRLRWPPSFVTEPVDQYALLGIKYGSQVSGRIPLPHSAQDLWAQHKYSVMARDYELYRTLGRRVARLRRGAPFADLAMELVEVLRASPAPGQLANALEHMWGYVSAGASPEERRRGRASAGALLKVTRELAFRQPAAYLLASTALSELAVFARTRSSRRVERPGLRRERTGNGRRVTGDG